MTDETAGEILESAADFEGIENLEQAPVETAFHLGLSKSIVDKIYKTGQTRGAEIDTYWQNRVLRNNTVLIPLSEYQGFVFPEKPFENSHIVLASPRHFFSANPPQPRLDLPKDLVLGHNLLVLYETRAEWDAYNPRSFGWNPAISRTPPLGGHYIARVPGTTSKKEGADSIREGYIDKDTGGQGAGIRFYEYASAKELELARYQLAFLAWRTEGMIEISREFLNRVAEAIEVEKENALNNFLSEEVWLNNYDELQRYAGNLPEEAEVIRQRILLIYSAVEKHQDVSEKLDELSNIQNLTSIKRKQVGDLIKKQNQVITSLKKLVRRKIYWSKLVKANIPLNPEIYKSNLDAVCDRLGLSDISRLRAIRAIDVQNRTVCPLCLKPIAGRDLASRVEQAEGRFVPDLTITAANLFHIEELKKGIYNHRIYNLGWGHHHCNATARDVGVDETLLWMDEVVNNPDNRGHINELRRVAPLDNPLPKTIS